MYKYNYLAVTLTFGLAIAYWTEPPIPEYLHICEKKDSNLTECLKTSIEILKSFLANGNIPNVNVPSFDPLEIGDLFKFDRIRHGLQVKAVDIVVMGILKFKIDRLHMIKHGKLYKINISFPKLQVEGGCELSGNIDEFSINENCSFVESFNKSSAVVKAHFSHINGWMVQTDRIDVNIKTGKGVVKLYDLDDGRRIFDLLEISNAINHHFDKMNRELVPVVEKLLQHQLKEMSNQMFGNFSFGQIFPLSF